MHNKLVNSKLKSKEQTTTIQVYPEEWLSFLLPEIIIHSSTLYNELKKAGKNCIKQEIFGGKMKFEFLLVRVLQYCIKYNIRFADFMKSALEDKLKKEEV